MASETTIFNLLYTRGVDMRYSIVHRMVDAAVSEPAVMANNVSLRQGPSARPCRTKAPCFINIGNPTAKRGHTHIESNDLPTSLSHQEHRACTAHLQPAEPLYHIRVSCKCLVEDSALAGGSHSPHDNAEAVFVGRFRAKSPEEPL